MTLDLVRWSDMDSPVEGRRVLAQFDDDAVWVYQAHGDELAAHALAQGRFGGAKWKADRLMRLRTSLPGVAVRSDWGRREGRGRILAIRLRRAGFDAMLRQAVYAHFHEKIYKSRRSWQLATRYAAVTVEWVPDTSPAGNPLTRERVRLGLRGPALRRFNEDWILGVVEVTDLVRSMRDAGTEGEVPAEAPYPLPEDALATFLNEGQ